MFLSIETNKKKNFFISGCGGLGGARVHRWSADARALGRRVVRPRGGLLVRPPALQGAAGWVVRGSAGAQVVRGRIELFIPSACYTGNLERQDDDGENCGDCIGDDDGCLGCCDAVNHPEDDTCGEHDIHTERDARSVAGSDCLDCLGDKRNSGERCGDVADNGKNHEKELPLETNAGLKKPRSETTVCASIGRAGSNHSTVEYKGGAKNLPVFRTTRMRPHRCCGTEPGSPHVRFIGTSLFF